MLKITILSLFNIFVSFLAILREFFKLCINFGTKNSSRNFLLTKKVVTDS